MKVGKTHFEQYMKICTEARYSLKGKKIKRLSDGMIGLIENELAYGKAYNVSWENGSNQSLGRSTLLNKKRYEISLVN